MLNFLIFYTYFCLSNEQLSQMEKKYYVAQVTLKLGFLFMFSDIKHRYYILNSTFSRFSFRYLIYRKQRKWLVWIFNSLMSIDII